MTQALSISRLIHGTLNLTPAGAQAQNLSDLLILGSSNVIDVVERWRTYSDITAVANDFGSTAPEYLAAVLWFEQVPQPTELRVGRWAKTATAAVLRGDVLSTAEQAIALWNIIADGSFSITIDGVPHSITGLNFTADTNLNGVASTIQAALAAASAGTTCVWDSVYGRFTIESGTTGAASTLSQLTAAGVGTDISGMLKMTSSNGGSYVAQGIAAETALEAATLFDTNFGQQWYGLTFIGAVDADHLAVAAFIEGTANKHVYGVSSQDTAIISAVATSDIAYQLNALGYKRTMTQYSSSNAYSVCSLMGRILTTDYNANNSVITLMYKQEPGIVPENLNTTQINALEGKNANVFVAYNNNTAIIERGVMASGDFIDIITGTDWLLLEIQTDIYNLLYTTPNKIPQTDAGTNLIVSTIENRCVQAVNNGLLAPGTWNAAGFGALTQGDFLPRGFYVYAPPVANQVAADRAARKSVSIQIAAKLAGAIHEVYFTINVDR